MTSCELRKKAAEVIEERGHAKGKFNTDGGVCILAAMCVAETGKLPSDYDNRLGYFYERHPMIAAAITDMGFGLVSFSPITAHEWNDAPERTKEQVLARLREGCA